MAFFKKLFFSPFEQCVCMEEEVVGQLVPLPFDLKNIATFYYRGPWMRYLGIWALLFQGYNGWRVVYLNIHTEHFWTS